MDQQITRRTFLAALVPQWITKRLIVRICFGTGAIIIVYLASVIIRNINPLGSLVSVGVIISAIAALWCLARGIEIANRFLQGTPIVIQAVVAVTLRVLLYAASAVPVIIIYRRWERGEDLLGTWLSIGGCILGLLLTEIQKQRELRTSD